MKFILTISLSILIQYAYGLELDPSPSDLVLVEQILNSVEEANIDKFHEISSDELKAAVTDDVLDNVSASLNGLLSKDDSRVELSETFNVGEGLLYLVKISASGGEESMLADIYIENGLVGGIFIKPINHKASDGKDF